MFNSTQTAIVTRCALAALFLLAVTTAARAFAVITGFTYLDGAFADHHCKQSVCKCDKARQIGFETLAIQLCTDGLKEEGLNARQRSTLLLTRGWAEEKKGDYEKAIPDLTEAHNTANSDYLKAFSLSLRGITHALKYQDAEALADMTAAIQLLPESADLYHWRGWIYGHSGDEKNALADFATAMDNQRDDTDIVYSIGGMYFLEEKFTDAASNFAAMVRAKQDDPESVLQLHLANLNAGVDDTAEFERNAKNANLDAWPGPLVKLMLGQISQSDAQAAVHAANFEYYEPLDRACEETFVAAEWLRFVKHDKSGAKPLYEQVEHNCSRADGAVEARNALTHL